MNISYRIITRYGCVTMPTLEALKNSINKGAISSPITRIQKITTDEIELPDFVNKFNNPSAKKGKAK